MIHPATKFLEQAVRAVVPYRWRRRLFERVQPLVEFVFKTRQCPCCNSRLRRFRPKGSPPRPQAACPICRSLERHRLAYLYLRAETDLFDGRPKKLLHVAPETHLSGLFRSEANIDYVSGDLNRTDVTVRLDVTDICFPDETFDVIYCSHVLEHVPDDRRAMREFFRVLKPGGWAALMVPISAPATIEDPSVTSPEERRRRFGQHDHVRRYGPDFSDRLRAAGFDVTDEQYAQKLGPLETRRFGLRPWESIFVCRKPMAPTACA